jgi:hypothetical protein
VINKAIRRPNLKKKKEALIHPSTCDEDKVTGINWIHAEVATSPIEQDQDKALDQALEEMFGVDMEQ